MKNISQARITMAGQLSGFDMDEAVSMVLFSDWYSCTARER